MKYTQFSIILLFIHSFLCCFCCDTTIIVAHRGVSSLAPENTLPAFQLGIDLNVDYIELDVQKSSDDSLMVIHDPTVNGTTNYSGLVSSYSYSQLKQMDAGSWFSNEYLGTEIPTLYESLALAQGKTKVCVELKASNIESQAIQLIEDMGMIDDVVIFSFSLSQLQIVKNINPNIKVCFLSSIMTPGDIDEALSIDAEILGVGQDPSVANIMAARNAGLEIWNYTVNDARSMLNKMSKGLTGIITDNAHDMLALKGYIQNGGLMAHWSFDENSGSNTQDLSHNGNGLNTSNASWATGTSGSALNFDGVNNFVTVTPTPSLNISLDAVSMSIWVKLDQLPSQMIDGFGPIYDSDEDYYILYLDKNNEELRFKVKDDNGLTARPGIAESELTLNQWIHIAAVYNGKEAMIFLNGELMDSNTTSGIGELGTNQSAELGRNDGNYFKGSIDEFRIYDRPLSYQEVIMLSTLSSSEFSFNEEQIYAVSDLNSNLLDDVNACQPINLSAGYDLPRNIFDFDGMHYVNLESVIDDIQNDSHSFFAWVKTSNPTSDERVFAVNDRYGGNRFLFGIHDGKIDIYVPSDHYSGSSLVNDDQWHYVGYTWNVTSNNLQLYVDGLEELSVSLDLTVESTDRASLGQEFDGFQASNYYHGEMADISIWNSSVNAGDIALHMISTINENASNLVGLYKRPVQCSWSLEDASSQSNHGVMCRPLFSSFEYLSGYTSTDFNVTWMDSDGNVLYSNPQLNTTIESSTQIYYQALNGNIHILDTIEIEAYPLPDLFLGSDTLTCAGNSLILDAGQHDSYLWNDNSTSSTLSPDLSVSGQYAYSVTVTNNYGCIAFDEINIEVQDCASFEDVAMEDIMFYPNPFREVIYSNVNLEDYDIEIYDIKGHNITSFQKEINALNFFKPKGIYLIKFKNDERIFIISSLK